MNCCLILRTPSFNDSDSRNEKYCKSEECVLNGVLPPSSQASLALVPAGVRLQLRSAPPLLLLVELQLASGGEASLVQVFASDVGSCDPFVAQDTPCSQFIIEGVNIALSNMNLKM